jgi:uncharacterized protein
MGSLYEYGYGVAQDCPKARQCYEKAAAAGVGYAMLALGAQYERPDLPIGCRMPQDYALARQWYLKAAAAGNGIAMSNLAYMYESGHGVAQDCR